MRTGLPEPAGERIPNLAPMVDVIMVLLIFFMLGASLEVFREGVFESELDPRSGPGAGAAVEIIPSIKIALQASDTGGEPAIYVMGRMLENGSFEALGALLARRREQGVDTTSPVVIAAQSSVTWRYVVAAMDAAVRNGFANVQFAVHLDGDDT